MTSPSEAGEDRCDGLNEDGLADYLYEALTSLLKTTAAKLSRKTRRLSVRVSVEERGEPFHFNTVVEVEQVGDLYSSDSWNQVTVPKLRASRFPSRTSKQASNQRTAGLQSFDKATSAGFSLNPMLKTFSRSTSSTTAHHSSRHKRTAPEMQERLSDRDENPTSATASAGKPSRTLRKALKAIPSYGNMLKRSSKKSKVSSLTGNKKGVGGKLSHEEGALFSETESENIELADLQQSGGEPFHRRHTTETDLPMSRTDTEHFKPSKSADNLSMTKKKFAKFIHRKRLKGKEQLQKLAKGLHEQMDYIKENYVEQFDSEGEEEEKFDFANIEIIVEEEMEEEEAEASEAKQTTPRASSNTRSRLLSIGKKKVLQRLQRKNPEAKKRLSIKRKAAPKVPRDEDVEEKEEEEESDTFEFSKADVIKSIEDDKLLQQEVLRKPLSPREADIAMLYGGVVVRSLQNHQKSKRKGRPRFGVTLRRKVKLQPREFFGPASTMPYIRSRVTLSDVKDTIPSKNVGLDAKPIYVFLYLMLPMLILTLDYLLPLFRYYVLLYLYTDELNEIDFDQLLDLSGEYQLSPLLKLLIPAQYHDILNKRMLMGSYVLRVGGLLVTLQLFQRIYTIFKLVRPKPVSVPKKASVRDERRNYKFLLKWQGHQEAASIPFDDVDSEVDKEEDLPSL